MIIICKKIVFLIFRTLDECFISINHCCINRCDWFFDSIYLGCRSGQFDDTHTPSMRILLDEG